LAGEGDDAEPEGDGQSKATQMRRVASQRLCSAAQLISLRPSGPATDGIDATGRMPQGATTLHSALCL